jgi:clock-associated PAS protein ZTL
VPFRGTLVCFRKDGTPLVSELDVVPVRGDPWRPEAVTLLLNVHHFRSSDLALGPLPEKLRGWLPDTLGGERAPIPTPMSWALGGGNARDVRDWVSELGDRELSHLLGFLNIKGLASIACTCRRMRRLAQADTVWRAACSRLWTEPALALLRNPVAHLGWRRMAREVFTLEALQWRRLRVGGAVTPVRTNFSTCGVGNRVFIFGGEGADASAYNDLFVLDLDVPAPAWQAVVLPEDALLPPGRWGHTLRELGSSALVLFGGCSAAGPLNDVFVLNLAVSPPVWREVVCAPEPAPVPRSWHGACTLSGRELLIFGGCSSTGKLLSDTWRLSLELEFPRWEELSHGWTPPARLGLSLVATEEGRVFAFGGLASAGPVRLRSQDAFSMDLRSPEPTWHYVTGSQLPSGAAAAGTPPPPRLEQVAGTLIGGRVLVFGGSVNGGSNNAAAAAWEPYVLSPNVETPTWRRLPVRGQGPRDAWGYSACMLGAHRFILAGKYDGHTLDLNELHELSLISATTVAEADASRGSNTAYDEIHLPPHAPPLSIEAFDGGDAAEGAAPAPGAAAAADALADALAAERMGVPMALGDTDRSSGGEEQSLLHPAAAQLRGSGGESPSSSDGVALPRLEQGEVASVRAAAILLPVLPILASGARLFTQLRGVMGGALAPAVTAANAAAAAAAEAPAAEGRQAAPRAAAPQAPPPTWAAFAASCEGAASALGGGGVAWQAAQSLEERERRRRSLARELGHPRPNCSSGSDEEPPPKRGDHQGCDDDGLDG